MANSAQARKRARQAQKRRGHNDSLNSELRTAIKKVRKAIVGGDKAAAQAALDAQRGPMDSISRKGIVHPNTTARYKSRLLAAIKALP
jgi:small subunit ribosomal protein S20